VRAKQNTGEFTPHRQNSQVAPSKADCCPLVLCRANHSCAYPQLAGRSREQEETADMMTQQHRKGATKPACQQDPNKQGMKPSKPPIFPSFSWKHRMHHLFTKEQWTACANNVLKHCKAHVIASKRHKLPRRSWNGDAQEAKMFQTALNHNAAVIAGLLRRSQSSASLLRCLQL
jgi:hypothetical protein